MATKKKMLQAAAGNAGGAGLDVEEVFSTYLYAGNSSTQTITNGIDLDGEGGLVWLKSRDASSDHELNDTERGVGKRIASNQTYAEQSNSDVSAFNSNGFDLRYQSGLGNASGEDYASWTFRKAPKFFDVVTYTGTGSAQTISHNLGSVPAFIVIKRTDSTGSWICYHSGLGADKQIFLDLTQAANTNTSTWQNTTPTDSVFYLGNNGFSNASGGTYVAYLFAHNDGDGEFGPDGDADIIKCGSYTGNGLGSNNDGLGLEIDLGFEPQWVMIKSSTWSNGNWMMFDSMRGMATGTGGDNYLNANQNYAEAPDTMIRVTPTGFKLESDNYSVNASIHDYIYIAIRRGTKVPESGTEVFDVDTAGSTAPSPPQWTSGFVTDFALHRTVNTANSTRAVSRLTGEGELFTNLTNAEGTDVDLHWDYMNGFWDGSTVNANQYAWMWKRAPNFFDVVAYTGTSSTSTFKHNLGVKPEMIWVKGRNVGTYGWYVYHEAVTANDQLYLHLTNAAGGGFMANTEPTAEVFTLGNTTGANNSSYNYIAYLFATLAGVSKVGSYTGNGSSQTIDCGFSSGARFVLIKKTSAADDWIVHDSERGIIAGVGDPSLRLNNTDPERSNTNYIDPDPSGFTLATGENLTNQSGENYIFYAIA